MKVLLAMSGGVDSSAAAVVLRDEGHDVVGVTMRLWGGDSDTGCCSVSDVDDARRVAQQVGIDHLVFNFSDDFDAHVVGPYVDAHVNGTTPNPCIECNRHIKFDRLIRRGRELGFDAVATGHHARIAPDAGSLRVMRGADRAKDQSYVVHMLSGADLGYVMFPVGGMQKSEVRELAARAGLRTAAKPDSQDVCFIGSTAGRGGFLGSRMELHPADVVDASGRKLGTVDAVELVTLGQRRGLGLGGGDKRYVVDVSVAERRVTVGDEELLHSQGVTLGSLSWPHAGDETAVQDTTVLVQGSAHGERHEAVVEVPSGRANPDRMNGGTVRLVWSRPQRRISPGQTVVLYDPTDTFVLGGGIVTDPR